MGARVACPRRAAVQLDRRRLHYDTRGLEEDLEVGAPMFHPEYDTVWADATPSLLGEEIKDMVATFLQNFENPVNSLPVDGGEYVWIVEQWETYNAVEYLFYDVEEPVFERLGEALNQISTEWVRLSDWDDFTRMPATCDSAPERWWRDSQGHRP